MKTSRALPRRLFALPMYLMLSLTRAGYQHAVRDKIKIRMPHFAVLAVLDEFGSCSQRDIAERIGFDKSDVTKLINDLEQQKLVERAEDEDDRRRHSVALTPKGKQQLEASEKELAASMKSFLRGLNAQEYRQLRDLLLKAIQVHDPRFVPRPANKKSTSFELRELSPASSRVYTGGGYSGTDPG